MHLLQQQQKHTKRSEQFQNQKYIITEIYSFLIMYLLIKLRFSSLMHGEVKVGFSSGKFS